MNIRKEKKTLEKRGYEGRRKIGWWPVKGRRWSSQEIF